jgi:hypothetical protein
MEVDDSEASMRHLEPCRQFVERAHEPGGGEGSSSTRTPVISDQHIQITVRPGRPPDEGVDAPSTRHPGVDPGSIEEVEDDDGVFGRHGGGHRRVVLHGRGEVRWPIGIDDATADPARLRRCNDAAS